MQANGGGGGGGYYEKRRLEKQIVDKLLNPKYYDKRVKPRCADHEGKLEVPQLFREKMN